jgi:hypothetical protein
MQKTGSNTTMTNLIPQLLKYLKENFGFKMNDSSELFVTEKNMLEYVMGIGRNLMNKIFEEMGTGYEGNRIEKDGNEYEFKDNRKKSIHGLFGSIDYKRAYYVGVNNTGGRYIPLDEKLGIRKKHTPGFNYYHACEHLSDLCKEMYVEGTDLYWEYFRKLPIGSSTIEIAPQSLLVVDKTGKSD